MSDIGHIIEQYDLLCRTTFTLYSTISTILLYLIIAISHYKIETFPRLDYLFVAGISYYVLCNIMYLIMLFFKVHMPHKVTLLNMILSNLLLSISTLGNDIMYNNYYSIFCFILISFCATIIIFVCITIERINIDKRINKITPSITSITTLSTAQTLSSYGSI